MKDLRETEKGLHFLLKERISIPILLQLEIAANRRYNTCNAKE